MTTFLKVVKDTILIFLYRYNNDVERRLFKEHNVAKEKHGGFTVLLKILI